MRGDGRLLSIAARARPVLVVVDDAQWLDAASRECIRFAARRASGRVAVVLAARDPEHGAGDPGVQVLPVGPLSVESARVVLDEVAPDVVAPVAAALIDAAAGNPLALVELPATLTVGQRAGREPLDLPLPAGARVREIVTRRMAALGSAARQLLLLVAADGDCDLGPPRRGCGGVPGGHRGARRGRGPRARSGAGWPGGLHTSIDAQRHLARGGER